MYVWHRESNIDIVCLMKNDELISRVASVLHRRLDEHGRLHGDVGAVVLGSDGNTYTGVCVDTPSWGLCAERSALAAMISKGTYRFEKVVAVWRDEETDKLHVLPPCGVCRQFMRDIDELNLGAIVLGLEQIAKLRDLLPYHEWPRPLE